MVPFRTPLADHLAQRHPEVALAWWPTDHMVVLSDAAGIAAAIGRFVRGVVARQGVSSPGRSARGGGR